MKLLPVLLCAAHGANTDESKPNIVFIFTDDQGFSDVSWKNRQVRTPNLDVLRRDGLTIEGAYSQSRCTPSRVSFMTGRYPWKLGFQGDHVIGTTAGQGIPLSEKLLPEYMKDAGYDTHLFGKWHLGYCDEAFKPQNRGFDTAFGLLQAGINYSTHKASGSGIYDYWEGDEMVDKTDRTYTTDDFIDRANDLLDRRVAREDTDPFFMWMSFNVPHSPVEAPAAADLEYFSHIDNADRREYLAALWRMDYKVGEFIAKMKETGEYDNTIFIYTSDNGPTGEGKAWPLRGVKGGSAEGGVRVPAFVTGPNIKSGTLDRLSIMHLMDWTATIIDFGGQDPTEANPNFDGMSFKDTLVNGSEDSPSPRTELFNVIQGRPGGGTYRKGDYKLSFSTPVTKFFSFNHTMGAEGDCSYDHIGLQEGNHAISSILTTETTSSTFGGKDVVMFNIADDPYELHNIFDDNQELGEEMIQTIKDVSKSVRQTYGWIVDAADTDSDTYPGTTLESTSGWCNAADVGPEI